MIGVWGDQRAQHRNQAWQGFPRHAPNNIEANVAIVVNESMAQSCHLRPRDFGMRCAEWLRDFSRSLAHDFELADDGALMLAAGEKRRFIQTRDERQRILGGT
jgi:hypothetical protein